MDAALGIDGKGPMRSLFFASRIGFLRKNALLRPVAMACHGCAPGLQASHVRVWGVLAHILYHFPWSAASLQAQILGLPSYFEQAWPQKAQCGPIFERPLKNEPLGLT